MNEQLPFAFLTRRIPLASPLTPPSPTYHQSTHRPFTECKRFAGASPAPVISVLHVAYTQQHLKVTHARVPIGPFSCDLSAAVCFKSLRRVSWLVSWLVCFKSLRRVSWLFRWLVCFKSLRRFSWLVSWLVCFKSQRRVSWLFG